MKAVIVKPDQVGCIEVSKSDFKEIEWDGSIESLCFALGVRTQYEIKGDELVAPNRLVMEEYTCYVQTDYYCEREYFFEDRVLGNQTRIFVGLSHMMDNMEVPTLEEVMNKIVFSKEEYIERETKKATEKVQAIWNGTVDED